MSFITSSPPLESSRPRSFPWDVLLLVVEQADTSTLAILGSVSLDFLVAASALLYKDVEVTTERQLEALFCWRMRPMKDSPPSRIEPHLSLSQIRTLSLNLFSVAAPYDSLQISSSRIQGSEPLSLESLHLSYPYDDRYLVYRLDQNLFSYLNPLRFHHEVRDRPSDESPIYKFQPGPLQVSKWSRLKHVDFVGGLTCAYSICPLVPIPRLDRVSSASVRLRVQSFLEAVDVASTGGFLQDVLAVMRDVLEPRPDGWIVLVVESEEQRQVVLKAIRKSDEPQKADFSVEIGA